MQLQSLYIPNIIVSIDKSSLRLFYRLILISDQLTPFFWENLRSEGYIEANTIALGGSCTSVTAQQNKIIVIKERKKHQLVAISDQCSNDFNNGWNSDQDTESESEIGMF